MTTSCYNPVISGYYVHRIVTTGLKIENEYFTHIEWIYTIAKLANSSRIT